MIDEKSLKLLLLGMRENMQRVTVTDIQSCFLEDEEHIVETKEETQVELDLAAKIGDDDDTIHSPEESMLDSTVTKGTA